VLPPVFRAGVLASLTSSPWLQNCHKRWWPPLHVCKHSWLVCTGPALLAAVQAYSGLESKVAIANCPLMKQAVNWPQISANLCTCLEMAAEISNC
jgi:hypothetical protein